MTSTLASFFKKHSRLFVLTGAGCSTASGIPDYRDERGEWKRQQPITYADLKRSEHVRRRYWARSLVGFRRIGEARPNDAHFALAKLERLGRLSLLVTQNVDGLHQRAGSRDVIDLHGRIDAVECLSCGVELSRSEHQKRLEADNPDFVTLSGGVAPDGDADLAGVDYARFRVVDCDHCGGLLKPSVVFFGETVPPERVRRAYAALESTDAMLVAGSSLMVFSGYRFVRRAAERGLPIAIVNRGKTRADEYAELKVQGDVGTELALAVRELELNAEQVGLVSGAGIDEIAPSVR